MIGIVVERGRRFDFGIRGQVSGEDEEEGRAGASVFGLAKN